MTETMAGAAPADDIDLPPVRSPTVLGIRRETWPKILMPSTMGFLGLVLWEVLVSVNAVPHYILPGPLLIARTLWTDWGTLSGSLWITLQITGMALTVAVVLGVALSILFSLSKWVELSFFPYAVILQVTPIVSIAPLIIIWVDNTYLSLLICAWIVAFFPILSNTTTGLNSADHNLRNLFEL